MATSYRRVFQFGPFKLATAPFQLYRDGQLVSITPKALATLAALVRSQGAAVSKEELLAAIWPDTVVEEANLSQNVYTLRKLLAADFPGQNSIENIPRFGYRFTLPVIEGQLMGAEESFPEEAVSGAAEMPLDEPEPVLSEAAVEPRAPVRSPRSSSLLRGRPALLWAILAALTVSALLGWGWKELGTRSGKTAPYEATRFTFNSDEDRVTAVGLSPDGNLVAYADADGVVLRSARDITNHNLLSPRLKVVDGLAWFPDQLHLVLSGEEEVTGNPQLWKISVLGEPPVLLRKGARLGAVSHDGLSVAFTTADTAQVWVMGSSGESARQITAMAKGARLTALLWAAHDDGLLAEHRVEAEAAPGDTSTGGGAQMSLVRIDSGTGKTSTVQANFPIGDACLTSSGDFIYSPNIPAEGSEATTLWKVRLAEDSSTMASAPGIVFESNDFNHLYQFSCDRDGKQIAVLRKQGATSIYVGRLSPAGDHLADVKRLSVDSQQAYPHGWSRDGRSVLYEATRDARYQIYTHALNRRDPEPLLTMTGSQTRPVLTSDKRWLLFASRPFQQGATRLYRIPSEGGTPAPVSEEEDLSQFRCPIVKGACVVRTVTERQTSYFELDPLRGKGKLVFREPVIWGTAADWDISPDGSTSVVNTNEKAAVPLHTVSLATGAITDIDYHPPTQTLAVNWASDGKAFYVSNLKPFGNDLSRVEVTGKSTVLQKTAVNTWAVPSPDGHLLAFIDRFLDSNVWLLKAK